MGLPASTTSRNTDDLHAKRDRGPGDWGRGRIPSDVTSRQQQRDVSPAGTWNRKQFDESLRLLRSSNLPTSAIEYCRRRARETGQLPHEFMTEIIEARRQRLTPDSLAPLRPQAFAEALPGGHARPDRRGTRTQLTAEGVLLSLGLVVVVIGSAASVGGLLHHAFAGINAWVASVNLR